MDIKEKQVRILMFKMPYKTKNFNFNQKVYIRKISGQCSAEVAGRRRGKYNYISCWIRFNKKGAEYPRLIEITVPLSFAEKLKLDILSEVNYKW